MLKVLNDLPYSFLPPHKQMHPLEALTVLLAFLICVSGNNIGRQIFFKCFFFNSCLATELAPILDQVTKLEKSFSILFILDFLRWTAPHKIYPKTDSYPRGITFPGRQYSLKLGERQYLHVVERRKTKNDKRTWLWEDQEINSHHLRSNLMPLR